MENYVNEIWKPVKNYEGAYEVSSCGRVRSLKRKAPHILKPRLGTNNYQLISLCSEGIVKSYRIHRLVAEAFIPNPDNLPTVDHINRNKSDNRVENLRWASHSEQNINKERTWTHSPETKLKVLCVETKIVFNNSAAAAHWIAEQRLSDSAVNHVAIAIRKSCNKEYGYKSAYGYHWEFQYEGVDNND